MPRAVPSAQFPTSLRAIIFDIGNVILRFDFNLALKKIARDCEPAAEAIPELIEPVKSAYEAGKMSRGDFQAKVRAILRYGGSDDDFVAAWEDIFTENEPMAALIRQIHGACPLYLLSNTNDIHVDFIFRRYPVFGLFTDAVYSYRVGASKPERAIYEIAARQFGVPPAGTLFIDDLPANVEAARAAGFRAHHYHHQRHDLLVQELRVHGLASEALNAQSQRTAVAKSAPLV
jgi:HAD superfamily hydrolase (TIGR01549 family)